MTTHEPLEKIKQPRFYYGYIVALACFLIFVVIYGAQYSFGVFFKSVQTEFNWTRAETSAAYSLNVLIVGILSIITGRLTDRFGPRIVATFSGLFIGLSYVLMSQISSLWQYYLLYGVLLGIGISGMWIPLISVVARWFLKRRSTMSGIVAAGIGIGTTIAPPLINLLISSFHWRTSYVIVGLAATVTTVVLAQFLKRDPGQIGQEAYGVSETQTAKTSVESPSFSLQEAIKTRQYWIIAVAFFAFCFGMHTIVVHTVRHALDIGIAAIYAAIVVSIWGALSIAGKVVFGGIGDKIGSRKVIIIIFGMWVVAFLWLLSADQIWMLYLFAVVFGLGYGGFATAQSPVVAEYFGIRFHGQILGMIFCFGNLGGAIGSFIAGRIFDITNTYTLAFIMCAALSLISIILTMFLKPFSKKAAL